MHDNLKRYARDAIYNEENGYEENDAAEHPVMDDDEDSAEERPERKLLRRELQAQALARLEDAARTQGTLP